MHAATRPRPAALATAPAGPWDGYDPGALSSARLQDFLLGGRDNFPADRAAARKVERILGGGTAQLAAAQRAFTTAAVTSAAVAGVTQVLDLGSGLPVEDAEVHDAARAVAPAASVVYVDRNPEVAVHSRALRCCYPRTGFTLADLRDPAAVLRSRAVTSLLDFTRPVAVVMTGVLHWVPGDVSEAVEAYKYACAPGSWLVLTHASSDAITPGRRSRIARVFAEGPDKASPRPATEIRALFAGWRLLAGGLADVRDWPSAQAVPPAPPVPARRAGVLGGIAVKPWPADPGARPPAPAPGTGRSRGARVPEPLR
jgi:hypothetical protein